MRTFTLAQLKTKVRQRADMESSDFVGDGELGGYISSSYTDIYRKLVKSGLGYVGELTQAITSNGATVALQADHAWTIGVDYWNGSRWEELDEIMVEERNRYQDTGSEAVAFRLVGQNIVLYPTPPNGQTYRHVYIPAPADLSNDGDVVDGVAGFEEYIVWDCAAKCLVKEEADVSTFIRERDAVAARIDEDAELRMATKNRRVIQRYSLDTGCDPVDAADRRRRR